MTPRDKEAKSKNGAADKAKASDKDKAPAKDAAIKTTEKAAPAAPK